MSVIQGNTLLSGNPSFNPIKPTRAIRTISETMAIIIKCESGGKHDNVWGKAGEYGIAQFKSQTFYSFARQARLQNADWKNKEDQLYLLEWALKNNLGFHWTCFK